MVQEIYISKELKMYIDSLSDKYNTKGIWLAKKFFRRWDFITGIRGGVFRTPHLFFVNNEIGLFIENKDFIEKDIKQVTKKLLELIYAN